MDDKKRKQSPSRGNGSRSTWILAGILAVLVLIAAALYFHGARSAKEENPKAASSAAGPYAGTGAGESGAVGADAGGTGVGGTGAGGTGAGGTGTGESGSVGTGAGEGDTGSDKTVSSQESDTEPETKSQPVYLESLSGISPGTILNADQIDFDHLDRYFMSWKIEKGDNIYQRINGKSYHDNDYVPLSTLRYLKMPHYNFDGQIQVGEMIVNEDIQKDVFSIFKELFRKKYQIQSMYLVDNYWTGNPDTTDSASIDVNNTSAFCFRQITGGGKLSNHAYGRAIDLNPQQNPYVSYSAGKPKWSHSNADAYIDRDTGLPHVITHKDPAYKLFTQHGFRWGGDWTNPKDYQHFDKNKK